MGSVEKRECSKGKYSNYIFAREALLTYVIGFGRDYRWKNCQKGLNRGGMGTGTTLPRSIDCHDNVSISAVS